MLISSAIWTEIHVFVRVVAATVAMWHAGRGVMEWTIIARGTREDGTKFSDAGENVGRKGWGGIPLGTMRGFRMVVVVVRVGVMSLRFDDILVVNRGATPARRFARRATVALFTFVTSTAARRRFTL